jgi:thymidylate synthase (FAD)
MQGYDKMTVKIERMTHRPGQMCKLACDHTMVAEPEDGPAASPKLLAFLVKAEHTSVLEHCSITFRLSGVSRSFMSQITRHRVGTFTCQSQHYQDYEHVPTVVAPSLVHNLELASAIEKAYKAYGRLQLQGVPKEEARQVLPSAAAVNILWTVNARSLIGFLRQRLCKRNVLEMFMFAELIQEQAMLWWPALFSLSGAPCNMDGSCNQGKMRSPLCK